MKGKMLPEETTSSEISSVVRISFLILSQGPVVLRSLGTTSDRPSGLVVSRCP